MKKFYLISYFGKTREGFISQWNEVIDVSPVIFLISLKPGGAYCEYQITFAIEVTEEDFKAWKSR